MLTLYFWLRSGFLVDSPRVSVSELSQEFWPCAGLPLPDSWESCSSSISFQKSPSVTVQESLELSVVCSPKKKIFFLNLICSLFFLLTKAVLEFELLNTTSETRHFSKYKPGTHLWRNSAQSKSAILLVMEKLIKRWTFYPSLQGNSFSLPLSHSLLCLPPSLSLSPSPSPHYLPKAHTWMCVLTKLCSWTTNPGQQFLPLISFPFRLTHFSSLLVSNGLRSILSVKCPKSFMWGH